MKNHKKIKEQLAQQYFGKETKEYDFARSSTPRGKYIVEIKQKIMKKFLEKSKGKNILDVACGTGRFFHLYGNRKIYGIDISKDQLDEAKRKNPKAILKVADAEKLPFKDGFFDVVITSQFIEHIPQYKKVIKEMKRVCKPGGNLIIDFPNKLSLTYIPTKIRILTGKLRHLNLFTKNQIKQLAKELNLKIRDYENTVIITPNIFPSFMLPVIRKLNSVLIKICPQFGYLHFVRFEKK